MKLRSFTLVALALTLLGVSGSAAVAKTAGPSITRGQSGTLELVYDWAGGDGYAGWEAAASGTEQAFRLEHGYGGAPGLSIWPSRDADYGPGFVEWRYRAPSGARIGSAAARLSYRNNLLAHHCVKVGLRSPAGVAVAQEICSPGKDTAHGALDVALVDPALPATATELFFQVLMPECKKACSKHIPAHDADKNFARLDAARIVLHDPDAPGVAIGGARRFVGDGVHELSVTARDGGVGVARSWLELVGGSTLATAVAACDWEHRTAEPGAGPCPAETTLRASLDTAQLPEGESVLVAHAADAAGNAGDGARLSIVVDRTAPLAALEGDVALAPATAGAGTIGLTIAADDRGDNASGIARVWLTDGDRTLASANVACSDERCPRTYEQAFSLDVASLPEGTHVLAVHARDAADNENQTMEGDSHELVVDRTPPQAPTDLRVARFDDKNETVTVRWNGDGSSYEYRYAFEDGWSDWIPSDVPEFNLDAMPLGTVFDVEVRAFDIAGNAGATAGTRLTVFAASEAAATWKGPAPPQEDGPLTEVQETEAVRIARADPIVTAVGAGNAIAGEPQALSTMTGELIGAHVRLTLPAPATIDTEWPLISWNEEGTIYRQTLVRAQVRNVGRLDLFVDFRDGRVISMQPDPDAEWGEIVSTREGVTRSGRFSRTREHIDAQLIGGKNVYRLTGELVEQLGTDVFWNWDFHKPQDEPGSEAARRQADWPVTLIWTGQADSALAKSIWNRGIGGIGNRLWATAQYARAIDAPPSYDPDGQQYIESWDSDRGVYTGNMCGLGLPGIDFHKWHYRVYATRADRMYNMTFGYYVFGTTHQDHNDDGKPHGNPYMVCPGDWYGGSEEAEERVAAEFAEKPFVVVKPDAINLHNWDNRQWRGNLLYDNNGRATIIKLGNAPPVVKPERDLHVRPRLTAAPYITGDPVVGGELTGDPGLWEASVEPAVTLRWLLCDAGGAQCTRTDVTGRTFALTEQHVGKTLRLRVTARTKGGIAPATSAATDVVRGPAAPGDGDPGGASTCGLAGDVRNAAPGAPGNDDFSRAYRLDGAAGSIGGSLTGGTVQQGAPRKEADYEGYEGLEDWGYGSKPTTSVWYCWRAPASGRFLFSTKGSPPPLRGDGSWSGDADPPRLSVYTGTRWGIHGNDADGDVNNVANGFQNRTVGASGTASFEGFTGVSFDAEQGTQYLIYVSNGSLCCPIPDHGDFLLTWGLDPDPDEDGVDASVDNCPEHANADQGDWDGNGKGNACDPAPVGVRVANQTRYRIVAYVWRCPRGFDRFGPGEPCYFGGSIYHERNWMPAPGIIDCDPFATCAYSALPGDTTSFQLRAIGLYPGNQPEPGRFGTALGYQGTINGGTTFNGGCTFTTRPDRLCVVAADPWAVDLVFRDDYDFNNGDVRPDDPPDGQPDPIDDSRDRFCKPRFGVDNRNQCHVNLGRPNNMPYGPYTFTVYVKPDGG